ANERIRIGFIGLGGQGKANLRHHLRNTVAVCDVDRNHLAEAKAQVERANGGRCADYGDYRRLLDNRDVDAVVISTPDHWHALPAPASCAPVASACPASTSAAPPCPTPTRRRSWITTSGSDPHPAGRIT